MRHLPIIAVLLVSVAACGSASNNKAGDAMPGAAQEKMQAAAPLADLGGAPTGPVYTKEAGETLALSGYDAVSYFNGAAPAEGSEKFTVRYQGYDYRFANAENAKTFQGDPAKYVPQYGGYCAWAIGANDALAPGDPNVYKIVDGKLYLNFNKQVAENWNKDIPGFISKGDGNYPKHKASEHYTTN